MKNNQNRNFKLAITVGIVLIVSTVFVFSFYQKKTENRELVLKYISIWESELSKSFIQQQNLQFLSKISEQVQEFGVEIQKVDFAIERLQHLQQSEELKKLNSKTECFDTFAAMVTLYGLPTASIHFCQGRAYLIQSALMSPYLILVLFVALLLPLLWAQISLSRYRQSLLNLMNMFQNWSELDSANLIDLQKQADQKIESDLISQKIIRFVQAGYQLRMQLVASQQVAQVSRQVAHDIRSPLTALNMLIVSVPELPEAKVGLLKMATEKIQNITDDLMSKAKNELAEKNKKWVEVGLMLQNLVAQKKSEYADQNIEFTLDSVALTCFVDVVGLDRVLSNLINNSVEAMANSVQQKLNIKIFRQDFDLMIRIQDTGLGIEQEHMSRLFIEGATFGKLKGTGMGLFHAQQWVHQQSGVLDLQSQVGLGTTVTIQLPVSFR